ncbi:MULTISPECIES: formyltetrahydrofolate deformylase [unclassified Bradyrhizobium]|uniref:formyltetrahydrofolate deformylase n=1 Tax=unclassified Bradyrhizobium TaxID=2631580 RepID=UPI001CD6349E|nr:MULTISPECIES: formyltetrahydrofolate deformylase [unclassified Bradyrhizobium]MCA1386140.1 formyltetrahydrofolate deformylase [Bradyrhizobium sp. BRP05]MCA1394221.1 formyltetrahydrofolate deformylase [Bradyrhizobium sp. IC3123]MCA1423680.1 formyltetrahydrofolate deformylase [Bradyrhizobium sp. BRP23]MCA1430692.1 formyltetrahydrofolate deformylase [Bradyrhizobium sp. NBAIM16]MCA1480285.1 formyltetrahydrofolate deformylase [Bradyrhizobium sp. NBAIM08]
MSEINTAPIKIPDAGSSSVFLSSKERADRPDFVLTFSCPDRTGIVHAVSGFLATHGCNIRDSAQFSDRSVGKLFMRISFDALAETGTSRLQSEFAEVGKLFDMTWQLHDFGLKPRLMIMVSRAGHCLNDLLFKYSTRMLDVEIPLIVSNHKDFFRLAASYDIPFHHLPITADTKLAQEAKLMDLVERERIDLIVLARYMQVLSDGVCQKMSGRVINIHHSFLPSFKGARPYHQAQARGVKLIGATAHYVTADLDEGPIIEQDVLRVDHSLTPEQLSAVGRDVEAAVLTRAVKFHAENRVLLNGDRTVVFG